MTDANAAETGGVEWLRRTIAALAAPDELTEAGAGVAHWNLTPMKRTTDASRRYPLGLHRHTALELCVAIDGQGFMDIEDRRYVLKAPALVVIDTGVAHSEGFFQHQRPYTAMWMSASEARSLLHASQYRPGEGWSCPWSGRLAHAQRRRLAPWFDGRRPVGPEWFGGVRAELLGVLGPLYREGAHGSARAPDESPGGPRVGGAHRRVLEWVRHYLDRHYTQDLSLESIAAMTRYSPNYLDALFARWAGVGLHAYVIARRMEHALRLCRDTAAPIHAIARDVGYTDPLYFSRAFRRFHGRSPTEARNG